MQELLTRRVVRRQAYAAERALAIRLVLYFQRATQRTSSPERREQYRQIIERYRAEFDL